MSTFDGPIVEIKAMRDLVLRFQACVESTDAIWQAGFDACRSDWERINWICQYRDYCIGERLVHYDDQVSVAAS
ncbi:MAG: hypothetical protein ACRDRO_09720 [Pseudonocardiaceae bacterium]